jgi:hypothetical protein
LDFVPGNYCSHAFGRHLKWLHVRNGRYKYFLAYSHNRRPFFSILQLFAPYSGFLLVHFIAILANFAKVRAFAHKSLVIAAISEPHSEVRWLLLNPQTKRLKYLQVSFKVLIASLFLSKSQVHLLTLLPFSLKVYIFLF